MTKKILVIGAGGIGSYFVKELFNLFMLNQIDLEEYDVDVADFDNVEKKNITYQDFTTEDLFKNKAEVMAKRYNFNPLNKKIEEEHLDKYDIFVICADNGRIRKTIFKHSKENDKKFIDLRSEGRTIACFSHKENLNNLNASISEDSLDVAGSCQLKHEFESGIIQLGNKVIAVFGAQMLLNLTREDFILSQFIQRI